MSLSAPTCFLDRTAVVQFNFRFPIADTFYREASHYGMAIRVFARLSLTAGSKDIRHAVVGCGKDNLPPDRIKKSKNSLWKLHETIQE